MITKDQLRILVGKNIEMLCFAQYSLYIHAQDGITLTVEGGFQYTHQDLQEDYCAKSPIRESSLMRVLECSITAVDLDAEGNLYLVFSNSDRLTVYKKPEFESYRLRIRESEFIA